MHKSLTTTIYQIFAMFLVNVNTSTLNCPNIVSLDIFASLKSMRTFCFKDRSDEQIPPVAPIKLFWSRLWKVITYAKVPVHVSF